jgi:hypothetical protein
MIFLNLLLPGLAFGFCYIREEVYCPLSCAIPSTLSDSWQLAQIYDVSTQFEIQLKLLRILYTDLCLKVRLEEINTRNLKTGRHVVKPGLCLSSIFRHVIKILKSDNWQRHFCPSVCPQGTARLPLHVLSRNCTFGWFRKSDGKSQVSLKSDKNDGYLT